MPVKRLEVLPQLVQPINRLTSRFSFTQGAAIVGIAGTIIFALTAANSPSLLPLFAAFAGFFAAVAWAAFFKSYEREAELVDHRRQTGGAFGVPGEISDRAQSWKHTRRIREAFRELQEGARL